MGAIVGAAQAAVGAIGAVSSISAANKQAQLQKEQLKAQKQAAKDQAKFQMKMAKIGFKRLKEDVGLQLKEVDQTAEWQTADRMMAADQELGSIRVRALERNVSGTTMSGFTSTLRFLEGEDLKRIEYSRVQQHEEGERTIQRAKKDLKLVKKASKKQIALDLANFKTESKLIDAQRSAATTGAVLGAIGSGLQIAGGIYENKSYLNSLTNSRSFTPTSTVTSSARSYNYAGGASAAYI